MLQSLDTLIAFVVILLSTSLLVTILVQMLSSAFALRGKNLGNALALTFQSIHPDIGKDAYKLAERVLGDPRLSDSTFANKSAPKNRKPDQVAPWGWWSLGKAWHLASAIRPEEIHSLLTKISAGAPSKPAPGASDATPPQLTPDQELGKLAKELLEKIGVPHTAVVAADNGLSAILTIAGTLTDTGEQARIATAISAAQATFKAVAVHITGDVDALTKWFNAAQDRSQQWFQMHTRIFTIICGILLAFLFQLDSVEIFKFVSTNAAARAALVGSADKLIEKADGILKDGGSIIDSIYKAETAKFPGLKLTPEALKAATNTSLLRDEIKRALGTPEPKDFDNTYDTAEKGAIDAWYKERNDQISTLTKDVAATGFDLLPKSLGHRWDNEKGTCWDRFFAHFFGMAITAGLLSLGAPYWFNLLKNLTSLRPALAQLVGKSAAETQPKK